MNEKSYVLAQSFNRANVQDRLWYVMERGDLTTLKANEKILFGDKAYIIKAKTAVIMGNDGEFYDM